MPVSYTHLDVYKRQAQHRAVAEYLQGLGSEMDRLPPMRAAANDEIQETEGWAV